MVHEQEALKVLCGKLQQVGLQQGGELVNGHVRQGTAVVYFSVKCHGMEQDCKLAFPEQKADELARLTLLFFGRGIEERNKSLISAWRK